MAKIAACMIVKNVEGTIERCIDSIRPFVDEINIYDTGSTDDTLKILKRLAKVKSVTVEAATGVILTGREPDETTAEVPLAEIRVKKGEWRNDFSWARTQSFEMVSDDVEWYFWLDDDDVIEGAMWLRNMAMGAHPAIDAFVMYYDYARDEQGNTICQLWRERLLRRSTAGKWVNAIHEVWLPKPEGRTPNMVSVPPNQVRFVHLKPPDAGEKQQGRNLTILRALEADALEKGEQIDLRTRAYLGTELMAQGDFAAAIPYLEDYINDPASGASVPNDERSQVFHKIAMALMYLGELHAAAEAEFAATKERDDWAENAVGLMEIFARLGEPNRVLTWAERALKIGVPQTPLIINPLEIDFMPRVRMVEALKQLGRFDEAERILREAQAMRPGDPMLGEIEADLARTSQVESTVKAILLQREVLIRHDENWKAYQLLLNAPYIVQDHPQITAALAMTRENVMHALKPDEYLRWYEDEPKESTVPDEHVEILGDQIERAGFTLEMARKFEETHGRKPRILDLGCNDAWMACFLWTKGGFVSDGIELNKASVEKGLKRLERFGAPGVIGQGNILDAYEMLENWSDGRWEPYDIVSCYEVYEHVPNTDQLLGVMESLLSPEGLAMITTPAGAFEDGNLTMWHIVERKGHLRAVTPHQLAKQLLDRGGDIEDYRVHQNQKLTWAAWRPSQKRGKVHLYAGGAWEPWSPHSIREGGLGGSETALTHLAVGLRHEGFDVRVFTDAVPGLYDQTLWSPASTFDPTEECDAIIVSRMPAAFDVDLHAPVRALWCHDHTYPISKTQGDRMTHIVTLSDWQAERTKRLHPDLADKVIIRRNGILLESYEGEDRFPGRDNGFEDRAPVCIYSSSADRGLDVLLELWPKIREQVPNAELQIYYGWDVFDRVALGQPHLKQYKAHVMQLADAAGGEDGGVFFRGRVGQDELRAAMVQARVWSYPTAFLETSCIGAMEARAAGLNIVTSDLGALVETVGSHGVRVPWSSEGEDEAWNNSPVYRDAFVGAVVKSLTDQKHWEGWNARAQRGVDNLDWRLRIKEWAALIESAKLVAV
jgi:glycosyltransferase involved in cell wall biosynthesis/2-polyprenyl-3-methyl-5-hydroxy-6-metoxy-1,4-benzoquinol methylase